MHVAVGSNIEIATSTVSNEDALCRITRELTIRNYEKFKMIDEHLNAAYGLPDYIYLWKQTGDTLIIPRGYIFALENVIKDFGLDVTWENKMTSRHSFLPSGGLRLFNLRDYQLSALDQLHSWHGGLYKAATGSGKTRVMLALTRLLGQKTLVLVEKRDLLIQWKEAAEELGFDSVGVVAAQDIEFDKDLVIGMRQTLMNRDDDLSEFGMVIVDEAHHASALTLQRIMSRIPASYRYGCSATPDFDEETWPYVYATIGPVVCETNRDETTGSLIDPMIKVINTDFDFEYHPSYIERGRRIPNNYTEMMEFLSADRLRNIMICAIAKQQASQGHICVILTKRRDHVENLHKIIKTTGIPVAVLTGSNSKEAGRVGEEIENSDGGMIVISTVMDEGTDFPRCDRLILAYPGRKIRRFTQAIGRIMRPHPLKTDAVVYDLRDPKVSVLRNQFFERAQQVYARNGYRVEHVNA